MGVNIEVRQISAYGKPQKIYFSVARPLIKGGGGRAWPLRKNNFLEAREKKFLKKVAAKLEGGGKALVAGLLKKSIRA